MVCHTQDRNPRVAASNESIHTISSSLSLFRRPNIFKFILRSDAAEFNASLVVSHSVEVGGIRLGDEAGGKDRAGQTVSKIFMRADCSNRLGEEYPHTISSPTFFAGRCTRIQFCEEKICTDLVLRSTYPMCTFHSPPRVESLLEHSVDFYEWEGHSPNHHPISVLLPKSHCLY
eukprot:scaffold174504_cov63-Attheya_sp.AAC.11